MLLKKFIILLRNLTCIIGLIIIFPFIFFAALAIVIEDGTPIFFIQERVGINQSVFQIIKIRTLKKESPNIGTHLIDKKYQLVSGRLLRKLKLDEFPQLINVIKGDINLIGPRPGLLSQKDLVKSRIMHDVFKVKPGITGLSQILGYDMSNPSKLAEVDRIYIENKSFYIDFLILIGTFVKFPRIFLLKLIE